MLAIIKPPPGSELEGALSAQAVSALVPAGAQRPHCGGPVGLGEDVDAARRLQNVELAVSGFQGTIDTFRGMINDLMQWRQGSQAAITAASDAFGVAAAGEEEGGDVGVEEVENDDDDENEYETDSFNAGSQDASEYEEDEPEEPEAEETGGEDN
jgi:hypothetical protein